MDINSHTVFKITREQAARLSEMKAEEVCSIFGVSSITIQQIGLKRFLASIDYEIVDN